MDCKNIKAISHRFKNYPDISTFEVLKSEFSEGDLCSSSDIDEVRQVVFLLEDIVDTIDSHIIPSLENPTFTLLHLVDHSSDFFDFLSIHPSLEPAFSSLPSWVREEHLMNAGYGADTVYNDALQKYHDVKARAPWVQEKIGKLILDNYEDPEKVLELAKEYRIKKEFVIRAAEKKSRFPKLYTAILGSWPFIVAFINSANVIATIHSILNGYPGVIEGIYSLIQTHQVLEQALNTFHTLYEELGKPPLEYLIYLGPEAAEWIYITIKQGARIKAYIEDLIRRHTYFNYYVDSTLQELIMTANPISVARGEVPYQVYQEFRDKLLDFAKRVDEHVHDLERLGNLTEEDRKDLQSKLLHSLGISEYYSTFSDFVRQVTGYTMKTNI